jgi:hypothetical protein
MHKVVKQGLSDEKQEAAGKQAGKGARRRASKGIT